MRKQFGLLLLFAASLSAVRAVAQNVTFDPATVINPSPYRIGINIGSQDYWSGELYKNLLCNMNCGFEPVLTQALWQVTAGTETTFRSNYATWDGSPTDYWKGATIDVVQGAGAEQGCIRKVTAQSFGGGNGKQPPVFTFSPACPAALRTGDLVVVRRTLVPTPESWWEKTNSGIWGAVSGGATLTSDTTDLVPKSVDPAGGGVQALAMTTPGPKSSAAVYQYFDTQDQNIWVKLRGIYQGSFDAKLVSGSPSLNIRVLRYAKNGIECHYTPVLKSSWTHYTFQCRGNEAGIGDPGCNPPAEISGCTGTGNAGMLFDQTGNGLVELDNLSFMRVSPADKSNPSVYRDEVIDALKRICATAVSGPPCTFRLWLGGQNAETMANWTKANNFVKLPTAVGQGALGASGATQDLSLNDFLVICRLIKAEPRIVIPVTFTNKDAANLIEFLAGPAATPYGAIRSSLGQAAPWTTVFRKIHLEFCNECWNSGSFPGQSIGFRDTVPFTDSVHRKPKQREYYYDYSLRAGAIFTAMRADRNYTPSIQLIMGFQTGVNYTVDEALARAHPDVGETAGYTMLEVGGPPHYASPVFWPQQLAQPYILATQSSDQSGLNTQIRDIQSQNVCGASHKTACKFAIYEFNNSTVLGDSTVNSGWVMGKNAPTQAVEDRLTQGAAQGVAQPLQALELQHAFPKIQDQNFFSLTEYFNGTPIQGMKAKLWGSVVDMGGATGSMRAAGYGIALANASVIGPEFSCPLTGNLTIDLAEDKANRVAPVKGVPLLYAFCYEARSGNRRSILLFNTDTEQPHKVTFSGRDIPSGKVLERRFAPASLDGLNEAPTGSNTNLTPATFGITTTNLTGFNPASGVVLPPHSITAIDYSLETRN